MNNSARRDTLVSRHSLYVRGEMITSHTSPSKEVVYNILLTCLRYPDGIEELIDLVRDTEGSSRDMQELDAALDRIQPPLRLPITYKDLGALYNLLQAVNIDDAVLPPLAIRAKQGDTTFAAAANKYTRAALIRHLADDSRSIQGTSTYYPLLAFVQYLIDRLEAGQPREALQAWLDGLVARLNPDVIALLDPAGDAAIVLPDTYYLLIALRKADEQRFTVHAWLWPQREQVFCGGPFGMNDMGDRLRAIFADERVAAARNAVENHKFIVEVFLPLDRIVNSAVEMWAWEDPFGVELPLGFQHPVVVRSMERVEHRASQSPWVARWRRWSTFPVPRRLDPQRDLCQLRPEEVQNVKNLRLTLQRSEFLCIMPAPQVQLNLPTLGSILGAGIPFVILLRQNEQGATMDAELEQLVAQGSLEELRHRLWEKRQDDWAGVSCQCSIILIWDEYDRLPKLVAR